MEACQVTKPKLGVYEEDPNLHHHQDEAVQEKCNYNTATVCRARGGARDACGDPSRRVWTPCLLKSLSCQSVPTWILLAHCFTTGRGHCQKCKGCQKFANKIHMSASTLKEIPITWPFAIWCLDMVGQFKPARGNLTHMLVMLDKFTK